MCEEITAWLKWLLCGGERAIASDFHFILIGYNEITCLLTAIQKSAHAAMQEHAHRNPFVMVLSIRKGDDISLDGMLMSFLFTGPTLNYII